MVILEAEVLFVSLNSSMLMAFVIGQVLYRTSWSSKGQAPAADGWGSWSSSAAGSRWGIYLVGGCDRRLDAPQSPSCWQSLMLAAGHSA